MVALALASVTLVVACAPRPERVPDPRSPAPSSSAPSAPATAIASVGSPSPSPSAEACVPTVPYGLTPPGEEPYALNHGIGGLWTVLWPDGTVPIPPENVDADGVLWMKFPWWRGKAIVGRLRVIGTDVATGASLVADIPDYGETGFQASGLGFAGEGCWDIVATAGGARLELVTRVRLIRP